MERLWQDLRYGFRMLWKSPGFTIVAVISLALGIGANTAIFSTLHAFLFSPLPVEQADRLVKMFTTDKNDVFSGVTAYTFAGASMAAGNETTPVTIQVVAGNYFDVLGVKLHLGRGFLPDEDKTPGTNPVVVLSYGLWQRAFGGSPSIVNSTILLNRQPFTVIGIAAQDFEGTDLGGGIDMWAPMMMHDVLQPGFDFYNARRGLFLFPVARLKPGVTVQQAQAAMSALASNLEREYKNDNEGRSVKVVSLLQDRLDPGGTGQLLLISGLLMGIVGVVLLIACGNVANLLLARATKRQREVAIRLAIGANRSILIRQFITESLLLSLIGGIAGFLAAFWSRNLI